MAHDIETEVRRQIWDTVAMASHCRRNEPDMYRFYMGRLSGFGTMLVCIELDDKVFIELRRLIDDTVAL